MVSSTRPSRAVALAALLATSTTAFAPPSSTSIMPSPKVAGITKTAASTAPSAFASPQKSNDGTSLNMYSGYGWSCNNQGPRNVVDLHNMFVYAARPDLALTDKLIRLAKGSMKEVVNSLDDAKSPEGVVNRALRDMQVDLLKIKRAYAESTDLRRRLIMQKRQAEAVADDWYNRAAYALKSGYETSAKDALSQRIKYQESADDLQVQIDAATAASERLYGAMTTIEGTFRDALGRRTELITRAKTAQSVKQVNELLSEMLSGEEGKAKSYEAFSRLEEKVEKMEAEADGIESGSVFESRSSSAKTDKSADNLESEFEKLETSSAVEDEYEKLKKEVKAWKSGAGGSKSFQTDDEIEQELKKLGRKLIDSGFF
mmetsp:Transcript_9624/g.20698  ORF Transcript_9624/g.20698 Transcript_9624/m.20698 type:complete len:373 (-) Transcript_9624:12-1130(-)